jgi:hypothetical protein
VAIGGDINYPGPGWYLHLLFVQGKIRLYVGQTTSLCRRIVKQHCSEAYRSSNPTLHYKAWGQAEWDAWVVLGCGQINRSSTTEVLQKSLPALPRLSLKSPHVAENWAHSKPVLGTLGAIRRLLARCPTNLKAATAHKTA